MPQVDRVLGDDERRIQFRLNSSVQFPKPARAGNGTSRSAPRGTLVQTGPRVICQWPPGSPGRSDGIRPHRRTTRTHLTSPVRLRPRYRVARPTSIPIDNKVGCPLPQGPRLQERFGVPRERGVPTLRRWGARRSGRSTEGRPDPLRLTDSGFRRRSMFPGARRQRREGIESSVVASATCSRRSGRLPSKIRLRQQAALARPRGFGSRASVPRRFSSSRFGGPALNPLCRSSQTPRFGAIAWPGRSQQGEHQNDASHPRNRRNVLSVRKPKEGSGRPRWQHRERQRIRQWSKALRSVGCTISTARGNTGGSMGRPAGGKARAAVTRHGCWRRETFEGHGATGEGESWKIAPASS